MHVTVDENSLLIQCLVVPSLYLFKLLSLGNICRRDQRRDNILDKLLVPLECSDYLLLVP